MLAALVMAGLCTLVGVRLAPRAAAPFASSTLLLLALASIGGGVIATSILVVGSLAGVSNTTLFAVLGVALAAGFTVLRPTLLLVQQAGHELNRALNPFAKVALAALALVALIGAAKVPVDFDALMYHLAGPATYLADGQLGTIAGNGHAAYLGVVHHLYLPLMAFGGPESPAVFEALCLIGLALAIAAGSDAIGRPRTGAAAVVLTLVSPMLLLTAVTAKVDIALCLVLVLALLLLIAAVRGGRASVQFAVMAGALFGIAVGIKALAAPFAVASVIAVLPLAWQYRRRHAVLRAALAFGIAAVIGVAPWFARNALLYGSPLYPTIGAELPPAWLPESARSLGPIATEPMHTVRETFTPWRWLASPQTLTPEGDGASYGLPIILLLSVGALALRRTRADMVPFATAVIFVGGVWLYQPYLNLRYLLPAIPLLIMATASALIGLLRLIPGRQAQARLFASFIAVIVVGAPAKMSFSRALEPHAPTGPAELAMLKQYADEYLSPDARLLFLWEGRGFGFSQDVLQDNIMKNWLYVQRADSLSSCLPESGVTHVVVSRSTMQYLARRGMDTLQLGWDRFPAFQRRCLIPLLRFPTHDLYIMRPAVAR